LEIVVLPLLLDSLLCLSVSDADSALTALDSLEGSWLWSDVQTGAPVRQADVLNDIVWYLGLQAKWIRWSSAFERCGVNVGAQSDESAAREVLLDWARTRLVRDQPLLQLQGSNIVLERAEWENMRRRLACQVLEMLLSAFEQA